MSSSSNTPPDGYFNDLSRPTGSNGRNKRTRSPDGAEDGAEDVGNGGDSTMPKPKRIACIICRKRKLKCDGTKPKCGTCTRLGHSCAYDEVRRKSGPKRGYVKALEERLKQVETLLKTQDPPATTPEGATTSFVSTGNNVSSIPLGSISEEFNLGGPSMGIVNVSDPERWAFNGDSPQPPIDMSFPPNLSMGMGIDDNTFTWEMIGLGLEEPLPPQESIDELHQIYFDKVHPSMPMIHKYRYLAAMNLAPNQRPPVCLRYAMWTLAASIEEKYMDLKEHFYQRSRKYIELDYLKGHGEHMISIAHAQTHILLCSYEFKMMYFPRAWMSTGSAIRSCQMMGLHRLDGAGLDVKQCLPAARDWTEKEERRRTFWMAFCEDRYASIGTGWPMTIEEKDILTNLPSSDESFDSSKSQETLSLSESLTPSGASKLSSFGGVVLLAYLFGRNLTHLHRPDSDNQDHNLNGEFWKRHRNLDNILLNTSLSMPSHLKLPNGLASSSIVFTNMNIHTSTICLHQAAIYKAEKNSLPSSVSAESKVRCITAANEIASIMRMISHMDLSAMNPFICFCLYVAARVFVQYLKSRPDDSQVGDSLRFLLAAMNAMKRKNPLTESFLVQLDVDLEGLGMRHPKYKSVFAYSEDNLGISSAKMPNLGTRNSVPAAKVFQPVNECHFMKTIDQEDVILTGQPDNTKDPISATSTNTRNDSFDGEAINWHPREQRQELQRTLQGLALGDIASYPGDHASSSYGTSDRNVGTDGLSPSTTGNSSSNRPTPSASTPSSTTHSNALHPMGQNKSSNPSYQTSPVPSGPAHLPTTDGRSMSSFFSTQPDYSNISASGLTPAGLTPDYNKNNEYTMPETPGRGFDVPPGWEMSQQTTGLTPVGDGVFRTLMGLGPGVDPMDIGWEGGS